MAKHMAASKNSVVRNAGIVAVAGAAVAASVAPANAFAGYIPVENTVSYEVQSPAQATPALVSYSYTNTSQEATWESAAASVTTQATAEEVIANAEGARATVLEAAYDGIGGAYVWGGKSYKAWDCSGFVSYVYAKAGINLTAYTYTMATELKQTSTPQPGDIVFTNGYAHVGIYVGDGKMISALNPAQGTQLTSVDGGGFMPVDAYYTAF